jgi:signal-transduction protein with cAMP-binding, CBS, and nucleotidyltransferase domain
MSTVEILKGHDLFRSLGLEKAFEIKDFSSTKKFTADETIFVHNSPASHLYMLMKGSVNLQLPSKNKDYSLVISKIEIGELFGLSPLLDSTRYTATAKCCEESEILVIEAKPFKDLLKRDSIIGLNIMNHVAKIYFGRYINVLRNLQEVAGQISMIR